MLNVALNSKAARAEQRPVYAFVANQGKKGFALVICGAGGGGGGRKASRTSKLYMMLSVNCTGSALGKKPLIDPQRASSRLWTRFYSYLRWTWDIQLLPGLPPLLLPMCVLHVCVCIYVCVYLTALPVPAANMQYFRGKQLTPFCFIAHLTTQNVQAKEIPKRSAFCHPEASNIKEKQHHVIFASTLTQSLKHNFYGFYFVLTCNTVFFYALFKNMCCTDLVIWVLDRIFKINL